MYKYLIVKVSKQYSATNCPELHDLNIPFSKICLGMKIGQQTKFFIISKTANSLYSLIADGQYRATSMGYFRMKELDIKNLIEPLKLLTQ